MEWVCVCVCLFVFNFILGGWDYTVKYLHQIVPLPENILSHRGGDRCPSEKHHPPIGNSYTEIEGDGNKIRKRHLPSGKLTSLLKIAIEIVEIYPLNIAIAIMVLFV